MAHGDPFQEGGPGHGEGGEGVPVDQNVVRPHLLEGPRRLGEDAGGEVGEGLALLHHVQVPVLPDAEEGEGLAELFPVLACEEDQGLQVRDLLEGQVHGGHLGGLRSCAEGEDHALHSPLQSALSLR